MFIPLLLYFHFLHREELLSFSVPIRALTLLSRSIINCSLWSFLWPLGFESVCLTSQIYSTYGDSLALNTCCFVTVDNFFFFGIFSSLAKDKIKDTYALGLPQWLSGKESACNAEDVGDVVWSLGQEDPLEKAMAPHSSILAWKIPWAEEPVWLQSIGLQRAGRDWSDWAQIPVAKLLSCN